MEKKNSDGLIPEVELKAHLAEVPEWRHRDNAIRREFQFRDFEEAMGFVNEVAGLAEEANHHPDIDIRWNKVTLALSTHSKGGLTMADFALAEQIDGLQI